jgi:hypothetical protein
MCEPALPGRLVAEPAQCFHQRGAGDIARKLHRASTSSRTKWSRIIVGDSSRRRCGGCPSTPMHAPVRPSARRPLPEKQLPVPATPKNSLAPIPSAEDVIHRSFKFHSGHSSHDHRLPQTTRTMTRKQMRPLSRDHARRPGRRGCLGRPALVGSRPVAFARSAARAFEPPQP